tara:strand:+ start:2517 stop:2921 length:405 start_codon:yes stop_codon:yes gene_type:complete
MNKEIETTTKQLIATYTADKATIKGLAVQYQRVFHFQVNIKNKLTPVDITLNWEDWSEYGKQILTFKIQDEKQLTNTLEEFSDVLGECVEILAENKLNEDEINQASDYIYYAIKQFMESNDIGEHGHICWDDVE